MKAILVLAGGRDSDKSVFSAALALARPLGAHLEFLHVRPGTGEAALYTPHISFARGPALQAALGDLEAKAKARSTAARHHFEALCERESIDIAIAPSGSRGGPISASWHEERNDAVANLTKFARHNSLIVIGRRSRSNGLPPELAERLLVASGRPILIAPGRELRRFSGTVLVCWKETAEAARALSAAMPILSIAKRVVIASIEEGPEGTPEGISHLAQRLEWDGIKAEVRWLPASPAPVTERLTSIAAEIDAGLLVMGAYGHGRMRELVFGGCTRHFLDQADRPVLMMH
jgi:nucleotide-binding universal stress UspA family protein